MDHLDASQIAALRGQLEREAAELRTRVDESGAAVGESGQNDLRDIEDRASREALRFQSLRLLTRDRARLLEVEAALARMASGDYGLCEESDDPIPFRRLQIDPAARYTAEVQAAIESERASRHDPNPEEPIVY